MDMSIQTPMSAFPMQYIVNGTVLKSDKCLTTFFVYIGIGSWHLVLSEYRLNLFHRLCTIFKIWASVQSLHVELCINIFLFFTHSGKITQTSRCNRHWSFTPLVCQPFTRQHVVARHLWPQKVRHSYVILKRSTHFKMPRLQHMWWH